MKKAGGINGANRYRNQEVKALLARITKKQIPRGLVLVIREAGGKFWCGEFRLDGKKFRYGYGNYPEISLVNARKIHAVARELIALGKHSSTLLDNPGPYR